MITAVIVGAIIGWFLPLLRAYAIQLRERSYAQEAEHTTIAIINEELDNAQWERTNG